MCVDFLDREYYCMEEINPTIKSMNWIKQNRIKSALIVIIAVFGAWFLFSERQADLLYGAAGEELLRIKERCKDLAEAKNADLNSAGFALHELQNHGYSEYKGFCWAEFMELTLGVENKSDPARYIALYNTTEDKRLFLRSWPDDASWYEYDFDRIVLGKNRIIDFGI